MNKHAMLAMSHWKRTAPDRYAAIADPQTFFRELGEEAETQIHDQHRFAALAPSSDETVALRVLIRTREDLVGVRVHLANQLRAELDASWPGARRIFAAVDTPIALAFLACYPTADSLAADAGQAPVAKKSGKRRHATFRWACDKRLRGHFATLADSTRHWHPWARLRPCHRPRLRTPPRAFRTP